MPLNTNCLLGVVNRLDGAVSFVAGNEADSLPASNMKLPELSRPYRSAGIAAPDVAGRDVTIGRTWIEIDLGAGYTVQMIALIQHNLSYGGTWRARLSNDPAFGGGAGEYDSGTVGAWPVVAGFGALEWGTFAWGGALTAAEAAYYSISSYLLLENPVVGRYLRLDLYDASNPAGFLQVGRCYAGPIWQPSLNMEVDWSIGWEDPSEEARAIGGGITFDERPRYRVAAFSIGHLPEAEALSNVFDYMDRRKGRTGDLIFIPQPGKPETLIHEAIYGRQRRLDPLRNPYVDSRRVRGFEIEELR